MKTELTLAVPTEKLWKQLDYKKNAVIKVVNSDVMTKILSYGIFKHRNLLEEDPSHKQIIPYAVILSKHSNTKIPVKIQFATFKPYS